MAVDLTPVLLSGAAASNLPIKVAATATPGTQIHQAHATAQDEIHLWAFNSSAAGVKLTIEWGGVAAPDQTIEVTVPPEDGLFLVIGGLRLTNSVNVKAFAASANVVMLVGFVNRLS